MDRPLQRIVVWPKRKDTNIKRKKNWKNEPDLIAMDELQDSLRKMENAKATGPDGINVELLKHDRENLSSRLLNCINACMCSY
jgi:hypothetical protein